uniref:Chitin-binding type-2 domain-containing protein n=1 Tax=Clytia hemisphaerica TaxID=252671 RepID=A0A7M5U0Y9_9CNID
FPSIVTTVASTNPPTTTAASTNPPTTTAAPTNPPTTTSASTNPLTTTSTLTNPPTTPFSPSAFCVGKIGYFAHPDRHLFIRCTQFRTFVQTCGNFLVWRQISEGFGTCVRP